MKTGEIVLLIVGVAAVAAYFLIFAPASAEKAAAVAASSNADRLNQAIALGRKLVPKGNFGGAIEDPNHSGFLLFPLVGSKGLLVNPDTGVTLVNG